MAALERIMYVEDEPDIQALARLSLEKLGKFTVLVCPSGESALNDAATFKPDMILLDVMMPDMDGPTTLRNLRLQPELAEVPVAFVTAKVKQQEMGLYISMGAVGVIVKPFDPIRLPEEVRTLWNRCHG